MDLLEYQAKELFSEVGIPVLPSQPIDDPTELKRLQIPYPVVLKSQVRAGGRSKAGGIRFVENTIDAIAAARTIFNLPIVGEYPQVLLAEARYDAQQEFFLAVVLDYQLQRPVLLGSARGGINVEALLKQMQKVVVDDEFSPFYARRLTIKMGLQGVLIQSVSAIIEKMYHLFIEKDLDLVEINPLGISADGELMALDGKITVNDNALGRHPDIVLLSAPKKMHSEYSPLELEQSLSPLSGKPPEPRWLDGIDEKGNVGIICNSLGLALATWDLISQGKGKPSCCLVVGESGNSLLLPNSSLAQQLEEALDRMGKVKGLKIVLVNILGSPETTETVAQAIADYLQPQIEPASIQKGEERIQRATGSVSSVQKHSPKSRSSKQRPVNQLQFVLRLVGGEIDPIKESLAAMSVHWTDNLEKAVSLTISLAKSK
ncbi:MAG: ATP-grasp domain-containing protein [Xenococcaceae cyanobacterium]